MLKTRPGCLAQPDGEVRIPMSSDERSPKPRERNQETLAQALYGRICLHLGVVSGVDVGAHISYIIYSVHGASGMRLAVLSSAFLRGDWAVPRRDAVS